MDRRLFVKTGVLAWLGLAVRSSSAQSEVAAAIDAPPSRPSLEAASRVISTHPSGIAANRKAVDVLRVGGTALDAVQLGVMVAEADPDDTSVGYGGFPNAEGVVELDAAIMEGTSLNSGAVAALRDIMHPVAVARRVMDETPHVLLVGDGARRFALRHGFRPRSLLTAKSRQAWKEWKRAGGGRHDVHDTMGMIVRAPGGTMAAACTTSGLAWKLPGRVGDSPLVGHGLYCDEHAGGACATGVGEEIIKVCGSYQVVEFLRQGIEPEEAIRRVIERILRRNPATRDQLIGFIAMRADGAVGYGSTLASFKAAVYLGEEHELRAAPQM